jgi:methionyl-tRNA formyltransferase
MINVHASILPRYRGAAPIQRAVMAGDSETGVTIMRIETELDAGATFASRVVPIPSEATSGDMDDVLGVLGAQLLLPVVDALAEGTAVETAQDHAKATFAPKMTKEEGPIDWSQSAQVIHDRVRGLQPWPLASTTLGGKRIVIRQTRVRAGDSAHRPSPGTVVRARGEDLIVACGGGTALQILEIQPEGKRTMTAREFLAGRAVAEGDRFGHT